MGGKLELSISRKYDRLQASLWIDIEETFEMCTNYDASLRPSALEVLQQLKASNAKGITGERTSLKVSQSTPIEEADKQLAEAMEQCTSNGVNELVSFAPANDGTNACTFLCLVLALKLFNANQQGEINDSKDISRNDFRRLSEF